MSEREDGAESDHDDCSPRQGEDESHADSASEPNEVERRYAEAMEAAIWRTLLKWRVRKRRREALKAWVRQMQRRCVRVALRMPQRHAGPRSGGGALHD
jgi:hypothetical protein